MITLEKAIKILTLHIKRPGPIEEPDLGCAIKLGIEALKAIKLWREEAVLGQPVRLLGETK